MKLKEIAKRIDGHLRRFEKDPIINAVKNPHMEIRPYFHAHALSGGSRVFVSYVSFQGQCSLTRGEAEKYLAWLDSGEVGKHYLMPKDKA